jgi:hypothetical protein
MKTIQTNKSWTLIINDTTGDLSVSFNKLPISSCPSALEGLTLVDGETYLKVICEMRLIADQAYFMCEHAEVVKDYNLITNQLLSYVHAMLSVDNDVKLDAPEPMQAEASQPIRSAIKAEYNGPHGLPKVPLVSCSSSTCSATSSAISAKTSSPSTRSSATSARTSPTSKSTNTSTTSRATAT